MQFGPPHPKDSAEYREACTFQPEASTEGMLKYAERRREYAESDLDNAEEKSRRLYGYSIALITLIITAITTNRLDLIWCVPSLLCLLGATVQCLRAQMPADVPRLLRIEKAAEHADLSREIIRLSHMAVVAMDVTTKWKMNRVRWATALIIAGLALVSLAVAEASLLRC